MRLGSPAGVSGGLWSTAPALRAWGAVSGPTMSIEIVEQWFQRPASASQGHPRALQGLPSGREAAAILGSQSLVRRGSTLVFRARGEYSAAVRGDRRRSGWLS
jgi:hypothetical protein